MRIYIFIACLFLSQPYVFSKNVPSEDLFTYKIRSKETKGALITTQDTTLWAIIKSHRNLVNNWKAKDPLTITTHSILLSSNKYFLKNKRTNEYVEAKILRGPMNPHRVYIEELNIYTGVVSLSDGSAWQVGFWDQKKTSFQAWQRKDVILYGEDEGILNSSLVLINISTKNHICVSPI